jgi:hypothetical protein
MIVIYPTFEQREKNIDTKCSLRYFGFPFLRNMSYNAAAFLRMIDDLRRIFLDCQEEGKFTAWKMDSHHAV